MAFKPNGIVTLCTDFGWQDGYVGAMKGVMLSTDLDLHLVDLAHDVPAQAVAAGALTLRQACPRFPPGTVHLAVVDPGVGTARASLVVEAGQHLFVGPDNGLLLPAAAALGGVTRAFTIDGHHLLRPRPSATFHGRDVFAPTAAGLASGRLRLTDVGQPCVPVSLVLPAPYPDGDALVAEILLIDRFGNLVACAEREDLEELGALADLRIALPDGRQLRMVRTYAEAEEGEPVGLIGSEQALEIAVRDGSAADLLDLAPGDELRVFGPDARIR